MTPPRRACGGATDEGSPMMSARGSERGVRGPGRLALGALGAAALALALALMPAVGAAASSVFRVLVEPSATYEQVYGFVGDYCMVQDPATHRWGLMKSDGTLLGDGYVYGTGYTETAGASYSSYVFYNTEGGYYSIGDSVRNTSTNKTISGSLELVSRDGAVIAPSGRYDDFGAAGDDRIPVCDASTGKWGYIDYSGKEVVACQYSNAGSFSNGYATISVNNEAGGTDEGLIDAGGDVIVTPGTYKYFGFCSKDGLISFADENDKWGYLKVADGKSTVAVEPQFAEPYNFSGGLAAVRSGGSDWHTGWKVITTSGETKISLADGLVPYRGYGDGFLVVRMYEYDSSASFWSCKGYEYLDSDGNVAFGGKTFYNAYPFDGGFAEVESSSESGSGFIDTKGNVYCEGNKYVDTDKVKETGLLRVMDKNYKVGVVDTSGNTILPNIYSQVVINANGSILVENSDASFDLFDSDGTRLTETSYQNIGGSGLEGDLSISVDSNYYAIERDGKWGVGELVAGSATTVPSAPQGLSAAGDDGRLELSWSAPASDGGSAVTGYSVYVGGEKVADLGADATSYVATGLANGTSYDVSVTARSAVGEGEAATTSATPPRASRLWGQGALDTMAAVVDEGFTETGGAVVLATGDGYWDALAASGVAGLEGAPVLLTSLDGKTLSPQTEAELRRLAPSRVYVCGGEMAVPGSVLDEVRSVTGVEPRRLWGQDATGTAVSIYQAGEGRWSKTAIVATSQSFMDALSVAPYAYWAHAPIFLARPGDDRLSDETLAAIQEGGFERVVVVGGAMVVSPDVEGQLEGAGISDVKRLWGQACADTSLAIAEWEIGEGMGVSRMGVATDGVEEFVRTGRGYWDSLCGAALCGRNGCILVIGHDGATQAIDGILSKRAGLVESVRVFGGSAAVSDSLLARVMSYLG